MTWSYKRTLRSNCVILSIISIYSLFEVIFSLVWKFLCFYSLQGQKILANWLPWIPLSQFFTTLHVSEGIHASIILHFHLRVFWVSRKSTINIWIPIFIHRFASSIFAFIILSIIRITPFQNNSLLISHNIYCIKAIKLHTVHTVVHAYIYHA